tara:strand:- start:345 stop:1106 length:762 start_codon:yes stop_codon:yes gene_type:complete
MKLIDILKELSLSPHYKDRKKERVDSITNIYVSKEALGNFTLNQVKEPLIKYIQDVLNKKLVSLESLNMPLSEAYRIGYKFFIPVIENNGKKYPITLTTLDGIGTYYYIIVKDNELVTLIISDAEDFEKEVRDHSKRVYGDEPLKILNIPGVIYSIDLNKVMDVEGPKKEKLSQEQLPYTIRTDYRKGADFEHEKYGKGKIVNTSAGAAGKGDANGKLDWVETDFGKEFVSNGKVQTVRRIPNIYTRIYFDNP